MLLPRAVQLQLAVSGAVPSYQQLQTKGVLARRHSRAPIQMCSAMHAHTNTALQSDTTDTIPVIPANSNLGCVDPIQEPL